MKQLLFNVRVTFHDKHGKPATANACLWPMPLKEAEKVAERERGKAWIIKAEVVEEASNHASP